MSGERPVRLAACTDALAHYFRGQCDALLAMARDPLLVAARDASDRDEEERLVSVLEEVETLLPQVAEVFCNAMLGVLHGPAEQPGQGAAAGGDDGLSLVETAKVDDWLRLRGMLERQSDGARQLEAALWERLAELAGVESNSESNPLSLQCTCVEFQAAMQGYGPGRDARAAIYDAFEATVAGRLNHLAARIQELLDEDPAALPAVSQHRVEPREPDSGLDAAAQLPPDGGAGESTPPPVDPSRVLGAMSAIQRREPDAPLADLQDLEARLLESVAPLGARADLDGDERRTLETVSRLVRELLQDPDVDPGVRRRLSYLAPALLMLALQDEKYLEAEMLSARYDPVTGLLDRTAFRDRLEGAFRRGRSIAVCLLDVDDFGDVRERLGHQVGGRLLRALADMLRKQAGTRNVAARLRGDEFAVLLIGAKPGAGRRFADRYLSSLSEARFVFSGEKLELHASIGVVESDASFDSSGDLMRAANEARNRAKADGGGCVRISTA